jgi:hypothetical protein
VERRQLVRVVVENRPIRGDDRWRVPGISSQDTEDGSRVPDVLYPILYARVSTDEQARSGYSLVQQLEALREYVAREGWEVEPVSPPPP